MKKRPFLLVERPGPLFHPGIWTRALRSSCLSPVYSPGHALSGLVVVLDGW